MRKAYLLVMVCIISLSFSVIMPGVYAAPIGQVGKVCLDYTTGYTELSPLIVYADSDGKHMSEVKIWDASGTLHIEVTVWSKPFLAYGEKKGLDESPKDGVMDNPPPVPNPASWPDNKWDIGSDGIKIWIEENGDWKPSGGEPKWEWKVSDLTKQDSGLSCESWTDSFTDGDDDDWTKWGIWNGPIVYLAEITIDGAWGTPFPLCLEVHASPPQLPEFWIPEFPFGTLSALIVSIVAIGLFTRMRKNSMSVPMLS